MLPLPGEAWWSELWDWVPVVLLHGVTMGHCSSPSLPEPPSGCLRLWQSRPPEKSLWHPQWTGTCLPASWRCLTDLVGVIRRQYRRLKGARLQSFNKTNLGQLTLTSELWPMTYDAGLFTCVTCPWPLSFDQEVKACLKVCARQPAVDVSTHTLGVGMPV